MDAYEDSTCLAASWTMRCSAYSMPAVLGARVLSRGGCACRESLGTSGSRESREGGGWARCWTGLG